MEKLHTYIKNKVNIWVKSEKSLKDKKKEEAAAAKTKADEEKAAAAAALAKSKEMTHAANKYSYWSSCHTAA